MIALDAAAQPGAGRRSPASHRTRRTESEIPFGAGPPLHIHDVQEDTFLVLEGTLALQVDSDLIELGPGDFTSVPPDEETAIEIGRRHGITWTGPTIAARLGLDDGGS